MEQPAPENQQQISKKIIPDGIKVVAVLFYLLAIFQIFSGILALLTLTLLKIFGSIYYFGTFSSSYSTSLPIVGSLQKIGFLNAVAVVLIPVFIIALGLLYFFIGRGLWRGRSWARIAAIIFAGLGILIGLIAFSQGKGFSFALIIQAAVLGYLWFSQSVKITFQK